MANQLSGYNMVDTIFAIATAPGRAGIAVIRISGSCAKIALQKMTEEPQPPKERRATLRTFCDPITNEAIDRGICLVFSSPNSYTGEDIVEMHVHGGMAVLENLAEGLTKISGLRAALPGEFTKRAFMNNRLDLTQVEAVADLINAETQAQLTQSLRQFSGELGQLYDKWRAELLSLIAYAEAAIDFVDEDLPDCLLKTQKQGIETLRREISEHLDDDNRGELLRQGVDIAIVGEPNVGKSSLLNRLARKDIAIVSTIAGTTRDVIETRLNLQGYLATIADTAGLRESVDELEKEGVKRAIARAEMANLRIFVTDVTKSGEGRIARDFEDEDSILVVNKVDLYDGEIISCPNAVRVSAATGFGIDTLLNVLGKKVSKMANSGPSVTLTRARHRDALKECCEALDRSMKSGISELIAEDLRIAGRSLGKITGKLDVENVLDFVFGEFCIGK